jgi:hypothetical protein
MGTAVDKVSDVDFLHRAKNALARGVALTVPEAARLLTIAEDAIARAPKVVVPEPVVVFQKQYTEVCTACSGVGYDPDDFYPWPCAGCAGTGRATVGRVERLRAAGAL